MNLESPKVAIDKSAQEVFDFLSNVGNFEKLMPENISKFEVLENDMFEAELRFLQLSKASFEGIAMLEDGKIILNNEAMRRR